MPKTIVLLYMKVAVMEGEKKSKGGTFNQDPHMILYGMPDFSIQDKWALLALMGMCWDRRQLGMTLKDLEGPYKLSLREIAAITGVKHNALRSSGGKDPRIGMLDRWQEIGYITVMEAKPIDEVTGKPGRLQTYIYVHLERIWDDNAKFTETWHRPPGRLVEEASFERIVEADTVHHVNTQETPLIGHRGNTTVHVVNTDVHRVNTIGHHVNQTVHDASTKSDTIHSKKNKTERKKEEDTLALARTSSHSSIYEIIINFIQERGEINFSDLETLVRPYMNVRGKSDIPLRNNPNTLAWTGLSNRFYELILELEGNYHVKAAYGTAEDYPKVSSRPNLPIAERGIDYKYDKPHWVPMVLIIQE